MNKKELGKLLMSDEVAGRIIRDVAELEWGLDLMLTRYFTAQERFTEFSEIILARFSFQQKIDVLNKMTFPARMKSQPNAVKSLNKFKKLRNILAHSAYISDEELDSIYSDNEIMAILSDYPGTYLKEFRANKNRLNRLMYSRISRMNKDKS
jgi:hypothetical protein